MTSYAAAVPIKAFTNDTSSNNKLENPTLWYKMNIMLAIYSIMHFDKRRVNIKTPIIISLFENYDTSPIVFSEETTTNMTVLMGMIVDLCFGMGHTVLNFHMSRNILL